MPRTDPVRPFISGAVANSLAAEVIALLHGLLTAPETLTAQTWTTAVEKVRYAGHIKKVEYVTCRYYRSMKRLKK